MRVMLNKSHPPLSPRGTSCAGLVPGAGDGPKPSCALPTPQSILLVSPLWELDPLGPSVLPPKQSRALRGAGKPIPDPEAAVWYCAPAPGSAAWGAMGGGSHGNMPQPSPRDTPSPSPMAPSSPLPAAGWGRKPQNKEFSYRYANREVATTVCCQERSVPSHAPADKWFLISLHPHALLHPCRNLPRSPHLAGGPGPVSNGVNWPLIRSQGWLL